MAKRNSSKNVALKGLIEMSRPEQSSIEYVTSRGVKVKLLALPPYMIQSAMESVDYPTPPTYKIVTDAIEEEVTYDQTSIDDPKTPEEDKKKWLEYQEAFSKAEAEASEILVGLIISESVDIPFTQEIEDAWVKKMTLLRIRIPEDHDERVFMYKRQYVIGDADDIARITEAVMRLTVVSKEEVDQAKKSFQGSSESNPQEG